MNKRDWKSRSVAQPESGHFLVRLVRKGPQVPARIVHQNGMWHAEINGKAFEPASDPAAAPRVFSIWHGGEQITEAQYEAAFEKARAPGALDPTKQIDLTKLPSIY